MAKKLKSTGETEAAPAAVETSQAGSTNGLSFLSGAATIDAGLASLFDKSAGPVQAPQFTAQKLSVTRSREAEKRSKEADDEDEEELSSIADDEDEQMIDAGLDEDEDDGSSDESDGEEEAANAAQQEVLAIAPKEQSRKRKRGDRGDDLEEAYMRRIEKEEAREKKKKDAEDAKRRKVAKPADENNEDKEVDDEDSESESSEAESNSDEEAAGSSDEEEDDVPPVHESLANTADSAEIEKSSRTVFLGNVSSEAIKSKSAKKTLLAHLGSFFPSLSSSGVTPKIESIRFRSTAFSTAAMPKRAAFAKREIMDSTTRSTNAYVVYNTVAAARKALTLNGSIVLDRHLRVDSVAHPAQTDNKRCVFVGNLGFVDDGTVTNDDEVEDGKKVKKKKHKEPADSEEGLWRVFNEHVKIASSLKDSKSKKTKDTNNDNPSGKGVVESVRVIRDRATRVGKGFAYVQFYDENAVEAALLLDGKNFPPLLPRKLRVTRAKRIAAKPTSGPAANGKGRDSKHSSMAGRAEKLFGRAGASKFRKGKSDGAATGANAGALGAAPAGNKIVFEGYRASENNSKFNVKTKSRGVKARGGKPKTRSARRAKAWKGKKSA